MKDVYVLSLRDVGKIDVTTGYKARALRQLADAGLEVPEGFVIASEAFAEFVAGAGIKGEIDGLLSSLNFRDKKMLAAVAPRIQELILHSPLPDSLIKQIRDQYEELSLGSDVRQAGRMVLDLIKAGSQSFVAVRPSPAEWRPGFAYPTELHLFGVQQIVDAVKRLWASAFSPGHLHAMKDGAGMPAVVVQKMVNAEKSGVFFTSHPQGESGLLVESAWGLGEWNSLLRPDTFQIDPVTSLVISSTIQPKPWMKKIDAATSRVLRYALPPPLAVRPSLEPDELKGLARLAGRLPPRLCVEWAIDRKKAFFLNAKPVRPAEEQQTEELDGEPLLEGEQLAGGTARGTVRILSLTDPPRLEKGDILVAKALMPELAPLAAPAGGLVVEEGGHSSFGAFWAREQGIPFVVAPEALSRLTEGTEIQIGSGKIVPYVAPPEPALPPEPESAPPGPELLPALASASEPPKICTVLSSFPEQIPADVGVIRPEACFPYGAYPLAAVRSDYELTKATFAERLSQIAAGQTSTVWYRLFDARSDELRLLQGGQDEPPEPNPALGWRGVRRLLDQPELYRFERDLIASLLPSHPNLGILLPAVSSAGELKEFKLLHNPAIPLGITIATPAAALAIADFCAEGVRHVCIDVDELAQLTLGVDRNNPQVSRHFTAAHPSVLQLVRQIAEACAQKGVETSATGSALSDPDTAAQFSQLGLRMLFLAPDAGSH